MSARRHTIVLGLLAALAHQGSWAQGDGAVRTLLEQGRYWLAQGRSAQAAQVWEKLLLSDPRQPEALYGMGTVAVEKQQMAQAQEYLGRLRAAAPGSRFVPLLEQDMRLAVEPGKSQWEKARRMAQDASIQNDAAGMAAAMDQFVKALDGKTPYGDAGREYYMYLGYTDGGTERAIQGLQRLDREQPGNPAVLMPLAQHMARDDRHRVEGIKLLEKLSARPDIGGAAGEYWKLALTWLGAPSPEEKPLFESYLKQHPDDEQIRRQMQQTRTAAAAGQASAKSSANASKAQAPAPAPVQDARLTRGFQALESGNLEAAQKEFEAKLQDSPNDANALGGLGVIRMQQNDMALAESLLSRAVARPGAASSWKKPLNMARYWNLVNKANAAQNAGDVSSARQLLEQAIRLDNREPAARNALARVYTASGDLANAEKTYRSVLAGDRDNKEAISGLVNVLAQSGKTAEATQLVDRLTPQEQAEVGGLGRLRAEAATQRAKMAQRRGDVASARTELEDAMRNDPGNPWIRLELARLYLDTGSTDEAQGIVDGLLVSNPDMPDAMYASALLSIQMGDWEKAGQTLAGIPQSARTQAMAQTEQQVRIHVQSQRAAELARSGDLQQARAILRTLEPLAGQNPELLGSIAQGYADAGDRARALGLLRRLIQDSRSAGRPDVLVQYVGVLLKTDQDVEAGSVLRHLREVQLSEDQRRQLDDLISQYTVRQADRLRERGDLVAAYDVLAPVLASRPDDIQGQAALARMYADGGEPDKALALYKRVLEREPNNANMWVGAALVAAQNKDGRYADLALERAVKIGADDPEILAASARVYRMRGKDGKASELLQAAIDAKQRRAQPARMAAALDAPTAAPSGNPFVGRPGQRTQSTTPVSAVAGLFPDTQGPTTFAVTDMGASVPRAPAAMPSAKASQAPVPALAPIPASVASTYPDAPRGTAMPPPRTAQKTAEPDTRDLLAMPATVPAGAARTFVDPQPVAAAPARQTAAADTRPETLQAELQAIRAERSPEVRGGVFVQSNNGTSGHSRLTAVQGPLEARLPVGDGKVSIRATPVSLNAGSVGSDAVSRSQFGGGPVAALRQANGATGTPGSQKDRGVGVSVGYEKEGFKADVGSTPMGFRQTNLVGGLEFNGAIDPQDGSWYTAGVSRRAVTDSLVSFAGARDARTGDTWGGVTASGLQGQIGADHADYGVYGYGSWQHLDGSNVASNTRSEVGGGIYWYLQHEKDQVLTAGLNAGGMFYGNNQRFFTYGNGGYFSPQEFYSLSVPLTWAQRRDRVSYKLQGSVGIQHFREKGADYFPTDSQRQRAAAAAASVAGLTDGAVYSGQTSTGVGYSLAAAAEYKLASNWILGGGLSVNNASDYRQWAGSLYLRYFLYPQTQTMDMPLAPYRSPFSR